MKYFSPLRKNLRGNHILSLLMVLLLAAISLLMFSPAEASTRGDVRRLVVEEAMNSHVPPSLAMAVAKVESDFQPKALSHAGARGVMQIMPGTAMGEYGISAEELWDARLNVQLGINFLESLILRYDGRWDLALSHYNGGSVLHTRNSMEPLPATRKYVETVLKWQQRYAEQATVWAMAELPEDDWRPARSREDKRDVRTWRHDESGTVIRRHKRDVSDGRMDDFGDRLEERRLRMRGTLDDFTSTTTWHEG
jgi:hypothetical protein